MKGKRTFIAGAVWLILFGTVHSLAFVRGLVVEPTEEFEKRFHDAGKAWKIEMGPLQTTALDTMQILSGSYSILLIFAGAMNLTCMSALIAHNALKRATILNIVFISMLLALTIAFRFPPPMVFAGIILFCFCSSLMYQMK